MSRFVEGYQTNPEQLESTIMKLSHEVEASLTEKNLYPYLIDIDARYMHTEKKSPDMIHSRITGG